MLSQVFVCTLTLLVVVMLLNSFGLCTNTPTVMGNKITYHSPSRGSSMELGASITILIFSQYKLPVSTSMCITGSSVNIPNTISILMKLAGATVGVGLCNGTFRAVNWSRVGLLVFS